VQIRQVADEGSRYAEGAFDGQIGERMAITLAGVEVGVTAELVAAVVQPGGAEALLTFDLPDGVTIRE
jgi:hypothetical protein